MKTKYDMREIRYDREQRFCSEEKVVFYGSYRQYQLLAWDYTPKSDFKEVMKKVKDKFYRTRRVN